MLYVLTCLQTHDWRLATLSACVSLFASLAAMSLYRRASGDPAKPRMVWVGVAGFVTGCGIWSTHFIAMLGYPPSAGLSFDPLIALISLIVAILIVIAGFAIAVYDNTLWSSAVGGAVVGLGIGLMHYLGVASLNMTSVVIWIPHLVVSSIVLDISFAVLSLIVLRRSNGLFGLVASAVLLSIAILAHHFVSVSAMGLIHASLVQAEASWFSPMALSIAIASVAAGIVVASMISAISDRNSHRQIEEYNIQLNAAVDNLVQGLCMFGPDDRLQVWNQRYVSMYNLPPDKVRAGCTADDLYALRAEAGTILKGLDPYRADLKLTLDGGSTLHRTVELVDGRTVCVVCRKTKSGGWVVTHEDITERRRTEAKIEYLARQDPLTGLANRIVFNDHIAKVWRECAAQSRSFTIMSLDVDRFSEINDTYGHATGDAFLCEVARRLELACGNEFIARLSGDEFVIVSSNGPQPSRAGDICMRALAAFGAPFMVGDKSIVSGCTVGVSIFPQDGADVETLVTNADIALYRAKREERGSIRFFEPEMDREIREKRALLRDLDSALANKEFELYFQPQTEADGKMFGFEALVRWRHPARGLVSPGIFIPLAEETGLITKLDEWILREVCQEAASWPNPLSIAINVSPISFRNGDLPGQLHIILLETGLDPKRLEVEITEGVLIEDFTRASSVLRRIKNLGVRVSIDDFGTGYSSLSYLQAFPFDKIKIDQTFVAQIGKNGQSSTIIRAIIGLGQALDLRIIAEGVETEQQLAFLAAAGCSEMQGYLLGRPQPISAYSWAVGRQNPGEERLAC
ncbi:MAG: EAL domain-containing protein [Xanthobacteraceae bacterium]|nr:EAL domain-containing protein [Xanthobacteraceae bacterium]